MEPRKAALLAAVVVAFTGAVSLLHGDLAWTALAGASAVTGLTAYTAARPASKKTLSSLSSFNQVRISLPKNEDLRRCHFHASPFEHVNLTPPQRNQGSGAARARRADLPARLPQ
jgi:hypothetical protein